MIQHLSKAIVISALAICATVLEVFDKPASGIWILIVLWVMLADWSVSEK